MPAARTTPRRAIAFVGRVCAVAGVMLVGATGCGKGREYAPDPYDRGIWRFGTAPADLTLVASSSAGAPTVVVPLTAPPGSAASTPTAPSTSPSTPTSPSTSPPTTPPAPAPTSPPPVTPPAPPSPLSTSTSGGSPGSYQVIDVKDGGSIRVITRLVGAPPEIEKVIATIHKDLGCTDHQSERCRFVKKGDGDLRLGNCLISLKSIRGGKDWPETLRGDDRSFVMDQKACVYLPHIGWMRTATQIVVVNSDRAEHNIHGNFGADTTFNFGSAPGTRKTGIAEAFLERPGSYVVKCDIHPWMNASLHVVEHPYYALTPETDGPDGPAGEAVLENVPPGRYEVVCWHEGMISRATELNGKINGYAYSPDILDSQVVEVRAGARHEIVFAVAYK